MLDERGVFGGLDGRDLLVEDDVDRLRRVRIKVDLRGRAVEVAGGDVPVLAFAAVHGQLEHPPIGAAEGLVAVEDGLDGVVAGGDGREGGAGEAQDARVEADRRAGAQSLGIHAEDLLALDVLADQLARLLGGVGREDQEDAAIIDGVGAEVVGDGDLEPTAALHRLCIGHFSLQHDATCEKKDEE